MDNRIGGIGRGAKAAALLGLAAAALLCGCARERVSVTVGRDGTWTRKAVYVVTSADIGGPPAPKSPDVTDAFVLPSGEGWKLTNEKTKEEIRVTAERTLPLDQPIENDIVVKEAPKSTPPPGADADKKPGPRLSPGDGPPKTLTTNTATVRQVSPGRYSYTETIHWTGEMPTNMQKLDAKELAIVKAALPGPLATDDNVKFVADVFSKQFGLALVGPPSPLMHRLPMLMSAPEIFVRLITRRAGKALIASLKEKFGDRMTAEQRRSVTARLIQSVADELKVNGPSQAGDAQSPGSGKNSSGSSIYISVRLPGKVVETNGIADPFGGDITWSFYPEAAALGDLTLTATCDANDKAASR